MHMPDLRRLLPLIILVDANSIDPDSTVAISFPHTLKSIPQVLCDAESGCAVDGDGAAQHRRTAAVRESIEGFSGIQPLNRQTAMDGISERASFELEDPDPGFCSVGWWL
jgi:hypothetical protein